MNLDNDQIDGHPGGLQKRGRRKLNAKEMILQRNLFNQYLLSECLWKVCSWALDKRTPVDPANKFGSILY